MTCDVDPGGKEVHPVKPDIPYEKLDVLCKHWMANLMQLETTGSPMRGKESDEMDMNGTDDDFQLYRGKHKKGVVERVYKVLQKTVVPRLELLIILCTSE